MRRQRIGPLLVAHLRPILEPCQRRLDQLFHFRRRDMKVRPPPRHGHGRMQQVTAYTNREGRHPAEHVMWTVVTIVYLVPGTMLATQLLSPSSLKDGFPPSESSGCAGLPGEPSRVQATVGPRRIP